MTCHFEVANVINLSASTTTLGLSDFGSRSGQRLQTRGFQLGLESERERTRRLLRVVRGQLNLLSINFCKAQHDGPVEPAQAKTFGCLTTDLFFVRLRRFVSSRRAFCPARTLSIETVSVRPWRNQWRYLSARLAEKHRVSLTR